MADRKIVARILQAEGWNKHRLAAELGVTTKTIDHWLRGDRNLASTAQQRVEQIAKELGILRGKARFIYTAKWKPVATIACVSLLAWGALALEVIAICS